MRGTDGKWVGPDLRELVDDPLRVAAPERERPAGLERGDLGDARERVRERQEQVDHHGSVAQLELAAYIATVASRFAWRELAALRRAGRARRVDDRGDVARARRRARRSATTASPVAAPRGAQVRQRTAPGAVAVEQDRRARARGTRRAPASTLASCVGVLAEHGADARVGEHVPALLGRVGLVDRDDRGAGARARRGRRASTPGRVPARMATRSPGSMPSAVRPAAISRRRGRARHRRSGSRRAR